MLGVCSWPFAEIDKTRLSVRFWRELITSMRRRDERFQTFAGYDARRRHSEGGTPTIFLKARLKAASDE